MDTDFRYDKDKQVWYVQGDWRIANLARLATGLANFQVKPNQRPNIDGSHLSHLDTTGAWLLQRYLQRFKQVKIHFKQFNATHQALLQLVKEKGLVWPSAPSKENLLARLGRHTIAKYQQCYDFLRFIGELTVTIGLRFCFPSEVQWRMIGHTIDDMGYRALPLVGFLSFLIGIVLTYQMGLQLKTYGANIYIVDLLGLSILREFGPLMTAILVAGRTASAFTAELGTMTINQEIDALQTMGIKPAARLISPRIFAMMIILPLLTVWANFFGIIGGMIMSKSMLHISFYDFIQRFHTEVGVENYFIGISKAPIFGAIIAGVGCFQGLRAQGSSDSVGHQTTISVVQSIFLIVIADAIFSVFFTIRGI